MRIAGVLCCFLALIGCGSPTGTAPVTPTATPASSSTATSSPTPPSTAVAVPVAEVSADGVVVPEITVGTLAPDAAGPTLTVTLDAMWIGDMRVATLHAGALAADDVRGGEHGFVVQSIVDAIEATTDEVTPLVLEIDPAVPYQTVARIVYSVGQIPRRELRFRARRAGVLGLLPVTLPSFSALDLLGVSSDGPANPGVGPAAEVAHAAPVRRVVHLVVTDGGIAVQGPEGRFEPGCERTSGAGVIAIPSGANGPDPSALATCLATVREAHPEHTILSIAAGLDLRFDELARIMAAARGTGGEPLFATTELAVR